MTFDSERELIDVLLNAPIQPELLLAIAPLLPPRLMPTAGLAFARLLRARHELIRHALLPLRLVEAAVEQTDALPVADRAYVRRLLAQRLDAPAPERLGESTEVERIGRLVQQLPIERRVDLVERFLDRLVASESAEPPR
jgi:hypothetical protein